MKTEGRRPRRVRRRRAASNPRGPVQDQSDLRRYVLSVDFGPIAWSATGELTESIRVKWLCGCSVHTIRGEPRERNLCSSHGTQFGLPNLCDATLPPPVYEVRPLGSLVRSSNRVGVLIDRLKSVGRLNAWLAESIIQRQAVSSSRTPPHPRWHGHRHTRASDGGNLTERRSEPRSDSAEAAEVQDF